jgi:hypothetical protein
MANRSLVVSAALVILAVFAAPSRPEVLHFSTPAMDAWGDSLPCEPSPAPVGPLGEVELWQLGAAAAEQCHAAAAPGAVDSFTLACGGEQRTYYVIVTKATGIRSCPSNLVTLNGRLAVTDTTSVAWLGIPRPNPTQGLVAVPVCLPEAGRVLLEVYDVAGRRVARILDTRRGAGVHVALWDARRSAPGLYVVVARLGAWQGTRRVLVLR